MFDKKQPVSSVLETLMRNPKRYIRINLNLPVSYRIRMKNAHLRSDDPSYKISFFCQINQNRVNHSNWAISFLTYNFERIIYVKK